MWYENTCFYQIYPLGLCGAPERNDYDEQPRIRRVADWIPHLQQLGVGAVLFNPVFQSEAHGYDTVDFTRLDSRLGRNQDFAYVCSTLHKAGLRVVLDGVFNHVGRGFWAFQDVLEKRELSPYKDWFKIDFGGNSGYNDGLWYEGWEGHYELVKLNLQNTEVVSHLLDCVKGWIQDYDIDGLRLDVAYCLDHTFMRSLRQTTDALKPDFFLVGEMLHGDYKSIIGPDMLHSATNYECYKGLYSSLNSNNLFEIGYSLNRQFGPEQWTLYKGIQLLSFVDNHDVTRAASVLENPAHLPLLYGLLFGMPGIPCLYYGSEWGEKGEKQPGSDVSLRPCIEEPLQNELTETIGALIKARRQSGALCTGAYRQVYLTNQQLVFERSVPEGERVWVCINAAADSHTVQAALPDKEVLDLISGESLAKGEALELPAYSMRYLQIRA